MDVAVADVSPGWAERGQLDYWLISVSHYYRVSDVVGCSVVLCSTLYVVIDHQSGVYSTRYSPL